MCAKGQHGVSNTQLFIKKNHRFTFENGGFLVAEAGLEPTTSGL